MPHLDIEESAASRLLHHVPYVDTKNIRGCSKGVFITYNTAIIEALLIRESRVTSRDLLSSYVASRCYVTSVPRSEAL
ncbi:hypothetical protein E2C01_095304 [Portunus trituberculatus]|uniref:Uncharacterized protein n=1 Tax=Portunus trituberculatus TaxID=210409 RepID=A0A5B7JPG8_PORTR|nr:hypothetical protein [Portunus trituberculatus]